MNNMGEELTLGQWLVMCLYVKFRNEDVAEETINERVREAFLDIIQQWASLILTGVMVISIQAYAATKSNRRTI